MSLEPDQRYSRQLLFSGIGTEGQQRLAIARVAIVGCGATGSALASLLARAGVGTIRIIDRDYVEPSNLQRQSLFDESDAAEALPKAIAAARKIAAFNSQVVVDPHVADLTPSNIEALKLLVGAEDRLRQSLLSFDLWSNQHGEVTAAHPRGGCHACDERKFLHLAGKDRPQVTLC